MHEQPIGKTGSNTENGRFGGKAKICSCQTMFEEQQSSPEHSKYNINTNHPPATPPFALKNEATVPKEEFLEQTI